MARRAFARIGTDLLDEPSVRRLTETQQRAYFLVLTRPELTRCGVVAYTPRRWAKLAPDSTEPRLRKTFATLINTRHVVVDEDTEELLVRTYVRHDGLLTQPNVVAAMCSDYRLITSPTLRIAFLTELRRIWDLDLDHAERGGLRLALGDYPPISTDPKNRFPDGMSDKALATLRKAIGTGLSPDMSAAIENGQVEPFDTASPKGSPQGFEKVSPDRPYVRADAAPAPTPAPAPAPSPSPTTTGEPNPSGGDHQITQLLDEHLLQITRPVPPTAIVKIRDAIREVLTAGTTIDDTRAGLTELRRRGGKPGLLPHLVADLATADVAAAYDEDPLSHPDAIAWLAEQQQAAR